MHKIEKIYLEGLKKNGQIHERNIYRLSTLRKDDNCVLRQYYRHQLLKITSNTQSDCIC